MAKPEPQKEDILPPDGQTYNFYPLTGTNPIRLLYRKYGTATQTFRYELKPVDLSSDPPPVYNCLSYTWAYPKWEKLNAIPKDTSHAGDRVNPVECDGQSIYVTDNLDSALTRLLDDMAAIDEETGECIPMWIDAICIHQESFAERNSQVAKMDEIYRNARKVIVWLGPEDENYTSLAVDVLSRLSAVPVENRNSDFPDGLNHRQIYTTLGIDPIHDFEWTALGELLMRTWFRRMWVIQETFEAQEVIVYCGKYVLSWQQIVEVSELLSVTGLGRALMEWLDALTNRPDEEVEDVESDGEDDENSEVGANENMGRIVYVGNTLNNQWLFQALREQKETLELETLLTYARYFGATGHSDYVYAVRGMWNPESDNPQLGELRKSIKPDYTIPVEDVFTAAAFASLIEMGDLNLLSLVEDHSLRETRAQQERAACKKDICALCKKNPEKKGEMCSKKLPSWVPDWSITPIAEALCMNPRSEIGSEVRWNASRGLPTYTPPPEPDGKQLCVRGICIATIDRRAAREPAFMKGFDGPVEGTEIFAALELLLNILEHSSSTPSNIIDAFLRTIIKNTYCGKEVGPEAKKAFASFLAGQILELEKPLIDPNPAESLETLDSQTQPADDSPLTGLEKLLENISAKDETGTIPTYQTVQEIIDKAKMIVEFTEVLEEERFFADSFRSAYVGRRLFYTKRDNLNEVLLGIGPESLKKGDEIWVISGANVPMVLRPLNAHNEGKWRLVGECYIHSIMGEAGHDVSGDGTGLSKKERIQDVTLV